MPVILAAARMAEPILMRLVIPEGLTGCDLDQKLKSDEPRLKVIYLSG